MRFHAGVPSHTTPGVYFSPERAAMQQQQQQQQQQQGSGQAVQANGEALDNYPAAADPEQLSAAIRGVCSRVCMRVRACVSVGVGVRASCDQIFLGARSSSVVQSVPRTVCVFACVYVVRVCACVLTSVQHASCSNAHTSAHVKMHIHESHV